MKTKKPTRKELYETIDDLMTMVFGLADAYYKDAGRKVTIRGGTLDPALEKLAYSFEKEGFERTLSVVMAAEERGYLPKGSGEVPNAR